MAGAIFSTFNWSENRRAGQVGLDVVAIRRIRIGRIALAKMPVGTWRCLPVGERF